MSDEEILECAQKACDEFMNKITVLLHRRRTRNVVVARPIPKPPSKKTKLDDDSLSETSTVQAHSDDDEPKESADHPITQPTI